MDVGPHQTIQFKANEHRYTPEILPTHAIEHEIYTKIGYEKLLGDVLPHDEGVGRILLNEWIWYRITLRSHILIFLS